MSFFDDFPALDITSIPGNPNHVTGRMVRGVPIFDGDPLSANYYVERFIAHASKEKVVHQDVLILLFMSSLHGHNSWLHNHEPRSISSIEEFFDGFLRYFHICPTLNIQEEAFIKHHDLDDDQGGGSSLDLPNEKSDEDNFQNTCDREDESMKSEVEINPTFSEDTFSDNPPFGDLGEGDPVTPSNIDINNYLHLKKGNGKFIGIVLTKTIFMKPMMISIGPSPFHTSLGL